VLELDVDRHQIGLFAIRATMKMLQVTLWIYRTAFQRSWQSVRKNWVVSFAPVVYGIVLTVVASLVAPLGIIGGFIYSLVSAACASSGLFLVKNMVESGKANFNDFLNGFTVYIWDVITISFILWIPMRVAAMGLVSVPNGALLFFLLRLGLFILLNAVPELIYQSRTSGLELIGASYNFIVENWLEWLIPNLLCAVAGYFLLDLFESVIFSLPAYLELFLHALFLGLGLAYFMTFRGFLFAELYGTTRRSRMYRYNAR
jgi:hypothetical protein